MKEAESLIKLGNYNTVVCQYLGIHESTWYKWLQEGRDAKRGIKKEFFDTIKKAESHAEIRNVQVIQNATNENWQASAWYLERKFHDRWGRKDHINANLEHTGKDGGPIESKQEIDLSNLTDGELTQLEKLIGKTDKGTDTE